METEKDAHINSTVAGIVMLAAIITTYTTYSYYEEDVVASNYESESAVMEQTASALVSLRLLEAEHASIATSTATTTQKKLR